MRSMLNKFEHVKGAASCTEQGRGGSCTEGCWGPVPVKREGQGPRPHIGTPPHHGQMTR